MNVAMSVRIKVGNVTVTSGSRNGVVGWHVTPEGKSSRWTLYYSTAIALAESLNTKVSV